MSYPAIPNEVFEIIFSCLGVEALRDVNLSCHLFHDIVEPFLFETLSVKLYLGLQEIYEASRISQEPDALRAAYERLEFFSSPRISKYVLSCGFNCNPHQSPLYKRLTSQFFAHLPVFQNLQNLSLSGCAVRPSQLAHLPLLRLFALYDCDLGVADGETISLSVHTLYLDSSEPSKSKRWISVVDPQGLNTLRLATTHSTADVLEDIADLGLQTWCIKDLYMSCEDVILSAKFLPLALSFISSVKNLHLLHRNSIGSIPFPDITEMDLESFHGPHYLLGSILESQKSLRCITLYGNRWGGSCDLVDVHYDLRALKRSASNLLILQLHVFPTRDITHAIATLFPNLNTLAFYSELHSQGVVDPMYALTKEPFYPSVLSMELPPSLQCITIDMLFTSPDEGIIAIETLVGNHPSLKKVDLCFLGGLWMKWQRTPPPRGESPDPRKVGITQGILALGTNPSSIGGRLGYQ